MYIVFLRFGAQRAQAGQWMAQHGQWLKQGLDDGVFLMAGSLGEGQGGVVLARGPDRDSLLARVAQDPFVEHGVVDAEVHAVSPSRWAPGMAELFAPAAA
ncbi:YciI family protein [Roseateles asaccharophilus]|uniref:Uncharacterized protein YciI n=1 Tax=Roseateles asaccharophilus TaxID=582607 RepID=A0ABU2A3T5_9BURK|nr:YciI family protein [Roseateles asaccharophilus]MDR7331844.1 uncharacterized protein YciI [Roseateles asaccharophilus]